MPSWVTAEPERIEVDGLETGERGAAHVVPLGVPDVQPVARVDA